MRIRKGDTILVIAGKDRGKTGEVLAVDFKGHKVLTAGINIQKRHLKPSRKNPKGGLMENPAPMNWSKVMLLCTNCGKPTRVGALLAKAGKERLCKVCKKPITKEMKKG